MSKLRVGILCEFSGIVRDAFLRRGHDAVSCDLLPTESPGPHIQGDCLSLLDKYGCPNCNGDGCERCAPFDLVIAFPPCTHLATSGARHFEAKRRDGRQREAIEFFRQLAEWPAPRVCVENPVGIMSTEYRKPDQIIQPWQFGDEAQKTTCLWLRGLPPLSVDDPLFRESTVVGRGEFTVFKSGKRHPKWYADAMASPDRAKIRSKSFQGIANAMAEQWGSLP